jgi:hypothetical protein
MFVTIVLNTQYMDYSSRIKWYLKNLLHSKENGWLLITHEYLYKNLDKLQTSVSDRFYDEFEMRRFTLEEIRNVEQYIIPDELFEVKEQECGSRTEMLFDLYENRFPEFEMHIRRAFDQIREKYPNDEIQGVFHCMEGFTSLRNICAEYNVPCIPYVFSAIRKVHGYKQTLYTANMQNELYSSSECKMRYENFIGENAEVPVLDHREIIALLGKERTLPLIKLLNSQPKYEICICGDGYIMLPNLFMHTRYTDEDIYYECNKLYPHNMIRYRQHLLQLNQLQIDHSEVRSDPASFMLSCKRVVAGSSQILLKAMLWNRTAIMKNDTIPFSFMCENDYTSELKVNLAFLNYYIFCYLIPSSYMFSQDYWTWRLKNPTETEIYKKHLGFYFNELNVDALVLSEKDKNARFKLLLESRDCDSDLIEILLSENNNEQVDYDVATSKLVVHYNLSGEIISKSIWRLNEYKNGNIISRFKVNLSSDVSQVAFYPLDDKAGYVKIIKTNIYSNNQCIETLVNTDGVLFSQKFTGKYEINPTRRLPSKFEIEYIWNYVTISDAQIKKIK